MAVLNVKDFNLQHTLDSGQYFTYWNFNGWHYVLSKENVFKVQQDKNKLFFHNISRKSLVEFFRLEEDINDIFKTIDKDKNIRQAISKYSGLRLMNQDTWQCILSFICSSNSNIPRIKKSIAAICKRFGKKIELDRKIFYTFPPPQDILRNKKILLQCGLGYRCAYLHETSKKVDEIFLSRLKKAKYEDAKSMLLTLNGVGDKVAECILLFSLKHNNAFPVDTWITKGMIDLYGEKIKNKFGKKNVLPIKIREFGQDYFGANAGYAQQYLFHWKRHER